MAKKQKVDAYGNPVPSRGRTFWRGLGKVFGTLVLTGFLTLLVFLCIFAMYVKNDLSQQVDFSLEGFSLAQTSTIC